jgi:hypothetical protein
MVTSSEVASLFLRSDTGDEEDAAAGVKSITIRVPVGRLAFVDSMAEQAGVSRNVMANHLLGVGVGAVMGELPDVVRDEVEAGVLARMEV